MTAVLNIFRNEIYDLESSGILYDLASNANLAPLFLNFYESNKKEALEYIKSVLIECESLGDLKTTYIANGESLYGYCMIFQFHPDRPKYLHKIFIKEEYRNMGLGSNLLKSISENSEICLLCPPEKESFYKSHGFRFTHKFSTQNSEKFKLTKGMYEDLCVMKNYNTTEAPIFLLNDTDIKNITKI